ncbi:intermembrane lipid transfer protein Vps13-like isoform X2 [Eriocheir sinensis]|uniref:intermembrane lipid transfer protein Vps13-like isoform X2 n=1 Tax=Eriocheir sinensis TaxID=95602 RepID=UPI0021C7EB06|nr:intermembrane lipid transfer protein Vps13-like isoform X2 [Eriocheir sinensis]
MFAKIISDVLNKFLGKYIENLDGSQLKIGVWGGDVELRDLDLKESALDELDLPVRLVCGHVGYLKLKIPWKNLFKERWEATVERVLVVVVPKTSIQYDAEKEEKLLQEGKMAALQRGEEARQKQQEMEKGDQSASQDGFFEKLCSQIIRNIQIFIKDIHVRYEDSLSCQSSQFAAGITLSNLTMQSTGADWIPRLDASKLVYKLNTLDCLGIYWNPDAKLVAQNGHDKSEMIKCLKELITSQDYIPQGMSYIIGPICSSAKLQLNPKPEQPDEGGKVFSIPFVSLDFVMDELAVGLTRRQYSGIMALLDSFDRLTLSSKYRKYRPQVHKVAGNATKWWHYAYECQLENIRRVHQNWSWEHMRQHRARCRQYKAVYKAKLENKLTSALTKDLQDCERTLDVFNITLVRRQAEMEVQREGRLRKQEKQKKGWFSGWLFGGGDQTTDDDKDEGNLAMKLKSAMTDEEKQKLHEAIGYSDSGPPPSYPEEFVDILLKFLLKQLTIRVTDEDTGGACVLHLKLDQVTSALENRSGASAVRVKASVQSLTVEGYPVEGPVPRLVTTETTTSGAPLLDVTFETNPLDKACDQRVKVVAQPIEVMYHAHTIIQISDVFAPPKDVSLQQLQAAALNQLEVVKERSVTGLQTAIDNHSILDLNLSFAASHIIIPENGSYAENCSAVVVTLGSVQMQSKPRTKDAPALSKLVSMGHSQEEVMNIVRTSSYDKFIIELVDIQALVSLTAEDWRDTVSSGKASPLHLLEPTTLHVDLHKCLLTNDPNLAKVKIHISLPDVGLSVADERLLQLAYIIHSIPKGEKSEEPEETSDFDQSDDLSRSVATDDVALVRLERTELRSAKQEQKETPQFTNLELSFVISEIRLELKKKLGSGYESLMKVAALSAKVELAHRTFDLSVSIVLGGILVEYLKGGNYRLLSTPLTEGGDQAFLTLNFTQVNRKSPDFQVKYGSTMQHLHVMVSHLKAHLEQSAILSILAFVEQLTYRLNQLAPEQAEEAHPQTLESDTDTLTSKKQLLSKTLVPPKRRVPDVTALKIFAKLGNVSLVIAHKSRHVAKVDVAGLIVNVTMKGQDTFITSQLKDFTVIDPSTTALHPKIVEIVGKEAWDVQVSLFGGATEGSHYMDMERVDTSITLTFGGARIVFLNKFVTDVLSWIDKFQAAKAALASASVAAAVAAQATLQEAYDKCARISMSFTLRAPLILVPQDSNSLSGLMVDLGLITIKNRFELGKERNELGYPAMFDKIQLELNQIKLSRVELSTEGTIERENNLLEPVSLTLTICRNLTISWLKQQPELDIQAKLKRIEISVSDEDFQVALSVLQDNLKEQTDTSTLDEPLVVEAADTMENVKDIDRVLAEHGHVFTKVKFSFTIEAVTVSLFTKRTIRLSSVSSDTLINLIDTAPSGSASQECLSPGSSMDAASPCSFTLTPGRSKGAHRVIPDADYSVDIPKEALSEISLKVVTLKGEMMSDGTLVTNLVLYNCVLQDTRPGQKDCINKMMERRATNGSRGMLDLTFRQGSSSDIFVDVRISGFILVLHLPYLLRIQRFFTDNLPKQPEEPQPQQKTKEIAKPKVDKAPEEEVQPRNAMTIRVKVEQPLIALVEDVSSINTSCIILHAEANCDIKMAPQHQNIAANVTNIEMYTCCFNPEIRQRTTAQIIDRCDVSFHHLVTPVQPGSIHVHLSQVNLRVSPAIIELLSTIATTLSGLDKADEEKTEEIRDWSGLWKVKPLTKEEFTLLDVEEGQEAIMSEGSEVAKPKPACKDGSGDECAEVMLECFLITLEAGSSTSPIPLIKLQTSVNTLVTGFYSKKLRVKGNLNLELASFNPRLAVWEPLLEPVEKTTTVGQPEHKPWAFEFEVTQDMSSGDSTVVSPVGSVPGSPDMEEVDFEEFHFPDPVCTISLTAKDPMELTVTKTFMEVVGILSEAFSEAYKRKVTDAKTLSAPYRIANYTGMHISVEVAQSGFKVATQGGEGVEQVTVESGAQVDLEEVKVLTPKHRRVASLVTDCQSIQDRRLVLKIPGLDCTCSIPVARADKRYFEVEHRNSGEKWGIVTSIAMESGCKVITLSSCVEVINHLDVPVEVYYMTERGNEVEAVVSLGPKESALLPLHAAYSPTAELFFCVEGHNVCILPFVWRLLQNNPNYEMKVSCPPKDVREIHGTPFLMFASGEVEQILWENTSRRTMKSTLYRVHLHPCLVLHNLLPVPISLEPPGTMTTNVIMPGASLNLTKAQLGTCYLELLLLDYLSRDWICGKPLEANPPELSVWTFKSRGDIMGGPLDLDLGMLAVKTRQRLSLSLYCPFWMINKSGLMLTYRKSRKVERSSSTSSTESQSSPIKGDTRNNIVVHEEVNNEAILFSFKSKAFFGKKKATVKVEDSDWSDKFSLDVVGSSGSVLCKAPNKNYQVGVDIQLGNSGLTKIVVFTPFYNILNKASYDIEVAEVDVPQAEWFTVMAGECIGWWPVGSKHQVYVRVRGTQDTTAAFPYDRPLSTVLALPNMYGGILGEVSMKESGVVIQFDQYYEGAAPALLINHLTNTTISIWQQGHDHKKVALTPMSVKHFTWNEPGGTLAVCGSVGADRPITLTLDKDDQGCTPDQTIHWAVFLQNQQRCVLFIDNIHIVSAALNAAMLERFQQEVVLSINSIGLSLVDDIDRKEVAYISLASSGVVWEHCKQKGRKHRPFTQSQTELLEKCYQLYQGQVKTMPDASCIESHYVITRNLEVDYAKMTVSKPFHRKIRRTFQPGVRLEFRQSTHQRQIHLKVNSLQVDNQACDVMFPVVLARVPTPRSVLADTVAKPFCEVSVAQKVISPTLTQFKYFAVLIQEFHAKVELPFVFAVMEVLMPTREVSTDLYSVEKYEKDEKIVHGTLTSKVKSQAGEGRKDYFDTLHLSPIKMHLSFSLSATDSGTTAPVGSQVIHLFLQSVGVTLTEVQDVVFRLAYMERQNQWMSWNQLVQEMIAHYQGQVMKQLYVLVLGLDVIGNPFGLVVGFTKGVEDLFYEPIQGAIEGPGEFAEGMVYGVTSFMGKTVGGAAGAVSRITGTIGKGVAALTLDDEYQKRRREAMHRKPADGIESLARGGKGIVTGVVDGVTGVFLKPIDGAREEGVEGFFKGMGKGVVGLVTRPASGVIDFASGSFDAVMRATDSTEEIMRRRPARFIAADGVIRPFVLHYAQGTRMLQEIEKGRYAKTDVYVAHSNIAMSKSVLVATDKRVMQVTRNDILGHLKVEWVHSFDEMSEPPVLTTNGLRLSVKQEKRRMLGVFGGGNNTKVVQLGSVEQNHWFLSELSAAYIKHEQ